MTFEEIFKELFETLEKENKESDNHSYFHHVEDKYDNGKHVYHKEKEVKDGKVIKDVQNTMSLEDNTKKENTSNKNNELEYYKQAYEEQNSLIAQLKERCAKLEDENNKIKSSLKKLIG